MRISENKIEEIRSAANIVDIISEHIQLRRRGKNYIGLCPFHNEKTPSFTVSEEKQIFHCFGCHAGGNVFKFLMDYEKISFVEAVLEMAERLSIPLETEESDYPEKQTEQEKLYDINTEAARYFSNNLLNHPGGEKAREYFRKRNMKPQTLRAFGLGYALPGWENFLSFLQERKIDLEKALMLGLIGQNRDSRLYDKFNGRIIFPIFSPNGRVVAFAGRIIEKKENAAKYLNSPESSIYVKGRILYGLSHAKDEIRKLDKAILVEGYMDLISLYQNGVKNVVAVSGTALTEEQVQLLSRYTKNVVLLFDADTAGIKASMRSIELLLKRNMEIKIASLPAGEDPDSYVNKYGRESFEEAIKKARNFLEYQTEFYTRQGMFEDPAKTAEAIRELVKPVALINDELKRILLLKNIAKRFNLREKLLESELQKALEISGRQLTNEERIRDREAAKQQNIVRADGSKNTSPIVYNLEKEIITLLFESNREVVELITNHISAEELNIEAHQKLYDLVYESFYEGRELIAGSLIDRIDDPDLQAYVMELTMDKYSIGKKWEEIYPGNPEDLILMKLAKDTVKKFKMEQIDYLISQNTKKIENTPDEDEKIKLMKINRDLEKEKLIISQELSGDKDSL